MKLLCLFQEVSFGIIDPFLDNGHKRVCLKNLCGLFHNPGKSRLIDGVDLVLPGIFFFFFFFCFKTYTKSNCSTDVKGNVTVDGKLRNNKATFQCWTADKNWLHFLDAPALIIVVPTMCAQQQLQKISNWISKYALKTWNPAISKRLKNTCSCKLSMHHKTIKTLANVL